MGRFTDTIKIALALSFISVTGCDKSGRMAASEVPRTPASTTEPAVTKSDAVLLTSRASYENITAQNIYHQMTGVTLGLNSPIIEKMSEFVRTGKTRAAVEFAVNSDDFINVTTRDFAGKMSIRDGETISGLNDFVATFMGVVRDGRDARELLTGNYYYRVEKLAGVSDDVKEHIVKSNVHYNQLDSTTLNVAPHLKKEDGQKVLSQSGAVVELKDAAGLLTSRTFLNAHANAGTNRRIVEYAFKMFLCSPIQTWASTQRTDYYIGRDVSRKPAAEFNNKCKGCHSGMDAFRPATAHFDFVDSGNGAGYIAYGFNYPLDPSDKDPAVINVPVPADEQTVPYKFRRAASVYSKGFKVKNDEWTNYTDAKMFGWTGSSSGSGMAEFGQLLAGSDRYALCLGERMFEAICKKVYSSKYKSAVDRAVSGFKSKNYNLKQLAVETALQNDCFGLGN